jgi:ferredoxin-type protein NapH
MPDRFRLLRLALTRPHRYRRRRAISMAVTLATLVAVPLGGLARVDLWGGANVALGRAADLTVGLVAVAAAIVGYYGVTFLVNMFAGRMFCGFGCPLGQLSRFADAIDAFAADAGRRRRAWVNLVAFAAVLVLATSLWWVSPRVFVSGEAEPSALAAASVAAATGLAVLHARLWRWRFCRQLCPIGLYYSVVQTPVLVGVDFDPGAACTECGACAGICPVELDPRRLDEPIPARGGLSFADLPGNAHCLRCGACVEICEHMMRKQLGPPAMGFRRPRARRAGVVPAPE